MVFFFFVVFCLFVLLFGLFGVFIFVFIVVDGVFCFFMGKFCEIIFFIKFLFICGFLLFCFVILLQFYKVCDFGYQFFYIIVFYQLFVCWEQCRMEYGFMLCVQFFFEFFSVRDKYFYKGQFQFFDGLFIQGVQVCFFLFIYYVLKQVQFFQLVCFIFYQQFMDSYCKGKVVF